MAFNRYLFFQKRSVADVWLRSKYTSDSTTPPNYFCVRIMKTFRFLFLLSLHSMHWSQHLFLCILRVVYQTVLGILFSNNIPSSCYVSAAITSTFVSLFLYFIFVCKNVTANDACIYLFVGFLWSFLISWNNMN